MNTQKNAYALPVTPQEVSHYGLSLLSQTNQHRYFLVPDKYLQVLHKQSKTLEENERQELHEASIIATDRHSSISELRESTPTLFKLCQKRETNCWHGITIEKLAQHRWDLHAKIPSTAKQHFCGSLHADIAMVPKLEHFHALSSRSLLEALRWINSMSDYLEDAERELLKRYEKSQRSWFRRHILPACLERWLIKHGWLHEPISPGRLAEIRKVITENRYYCYSRHRQILEALLQGIVIASKAKDPLLDDLLKVDLLEIKKEDHLQDICVPKGMRKRSMEDFIELHQALNREYQKANSYTNDMTASMLTRWDARWVKHRIETLRKQIYWLTSSSEAPFQLTTDKQRLFPSIRIKNTDKEINPSAAPETIYLVAVLTPLIEKTQQLLQNCYKNDYQNFSPLCQSLGKLIYKVRHEEKKIQENQYSNEAKSELNLFLKAVHQNIDDIQYRLVVFCWRTLVFCHFSGGKKKHPTIYETTQSLLSSIKPNQINDSALRLGDTIGKGISLTCYRNDLLSLLNGQPGQETAELCTRHRYRLSQAASNEILIHSVETGNKKAAKQAISSGASINITDDSGHDLLTIATLNNNTHMLRLLESLGAPSKEVILDGIPLLHLAAKLGKTAALNYFLQKEININSEDIFGRTPLWHAANSSELKSMSILLKQNADPNQPDLEKISPIMLAISHGSKASIQMLIQHGAVRDFDDLSSQSILRHAVSHNHLSGLETLIQIESDKKSILLKQLALQGTRLGNLDALVLAYRQGASLKQGCSLLHIAAKKGHINILQWLTKEAPYLLNQLDSKNQLPLFYAIENEKKEAAYYLYQMNPTVLSLYQASRNMTFPLWVMAMTHDHLELFFSLMERGIDSKDYENKPGYYPTVLAAKFCHPILERLHPLFPRLDIVGAYLTPLLINIARWNQRINHQWLLERGEIEKPVQQEILRKYFKSSLMGLRLKRIEWHHLFAYACLDEDPNPDWLPHGKAELQECLYFALLDANKTTLRILLNHGAQLNQPFERGFSALHVAALSDDIDFYEEIERRGKFSYLTTQGLSPLGTVVKRGIFGMTLLLLEKGLAPEEARIFKCKFHIFHLAAYYGHLDIIEYFLTNHPFFETPVDLRVENLPDHPNHPWSGWTALHIAAARGHDKIVSYLLEQGADPLAEGHSHLQNYPEARGILPLHLAAASGNSMAATILHERAPEALFRTYWPDRDNRPVTDIVAWLPIHFAVLSNNLKIATYFKEAWYYQSRKIPRSQFRSYYSSLLLLATCLGHQDLLELFFNAALHDDPELILPAIHVAFDQKQNQAASKLLSLLSDSYNHKNNQRAIRLLNAADKGGQPLLHKAVREQNRDGVFHLLWMQACYNIKIKQGWFSRIDAIELAKSIGNNNVTKVLVSKAEYDKKRSYYHDPSSYYSQSITVPNSRIAYQSIFIKKYLKSSPISRPSPPNSTNSNQSPCKL